MRHCQPKGTETDRLNLSYSRHRSTRRMSNRIAWERLNKFYAQIFSCYVIFVNRIGYEGENRFWGESAVIAPGGKEVTKADYYKEQLITAIVDLKKCGIIGIFCQNLEKRKLI